MQIGVDFCTPNAELYLCPTSKLFFLSCFFRTLNRGHFVVKTSARNEALPRPRQIGVARGRHDGHDYSLPGEIPLLDRPRVSLTLAISAVSVSARARAAFYPIPRDLYPAAARNNAEQYLPSSFRVAFISRGGGCLAKFA